MIVTLYTFSAIGIHLAKHCASHIIPRIIQTGGENAVQKYINLGRIDANIAENYAAENNLGKSAESLFTNRDIVLLCKSKTISNEAGSVEFSTVFKLILCVNREGFRIV